MADIFLSYASDDRDRARTFATALSEAGWDVWWDQNIRSGEDWDRRIEQELEQTGLVVTLFSAQANESRWVRAESMFAVEHDKLLPVLIEDVRLPHIFATVQAVDGTDVANVVTAVADFFAHRADSSASAETFTSTPPEPAARSPIWALLAVCGMLIVAVGIWQTTVVSVEKPEDWAHVDKRIDAALKSPTRLDDLQDIVAEHPEYARGWVELSQTHRFRGEEALGREPALRAIALDPTYVPALLLMPWYSSAGEQGHYYEEALRLEDPPSQPLVSAAAFYFGGAGESERAVELFEQGLALYPDDASMHRAYARMLMSFSAQRPTQALGHLELATAIDGVRGYRAPYYKNINDLYSSYFALFEHYLANPGSSALQFSWHMTEDAALEWIDIAEQHGVNPDQVAYERQRFLANSGRLEEAAGVIDQYKLAYPDRPVPMTMQYWLEVAAAAARRGDMDEFMKLRTAARAELESTLAPYKTLEGYRIAHYTELWFSEVNFFGLMMVTWSLGDEYVSSQIAEALEAHWATPRITNLGQDIKFLQLASIAAMREDYEAVLQRLDEGFRRGLDPRTIQEIASKYDVHDAWQTWLNDRRYLELVERSDNMRDEVRARAEAEQPLLFNPDFEELQALRAQRVAQGN